MASPSPPTPLPHGEREKSGSSPSRKRGAAFSWLRQQLPRLFRAAGVRQIANQLAITLLGGGFFAVLFEALVQLQPGGGLLFVFRLGFLRQVALDQLAAGLLHVGIVAQRGPGQGRQDAV